MKQQNIKSKLLYLLHENYNIPENLLIEENFDKPLTGAILRIDGITMTYLFFDVQKEFNIRINAEKILNYEFNTINGIVKLIETTFLE